jgi:hypothetical protein
MKKNEVLTNNEKSIGIATICGWLLIGFGVMDFALSFMGINLTGFLGPISRFSPIAAGLLGSFLINTDKN